MALDGSHITGNRAALNYDSKNADYRALVTGGLTTTDPVLIARKNSILQSQSYVADFEDWNLSGDATLTWKPSEAVLGYLTAARAFRSGGVNLSGIPNRADGTPAVEVATVAPETITHVEAGLKIGWPHARLSGALAIFRTRIDDYQATVVNGATGTLRGYLANAEQVSTQGVELDLRYRPTRQITLSGSIAWTDARYDRFPDAPPALEQSGGAVQFVDISGQRLPGVSEWATTLAVEVVRPEPFGLSGLEAWFGVDASYRSDWSSSASPSAFMMVDAATITNLRVGLRQPGGWNIWLWARNVANTETFDYLTAQSGSTGLIVGAPSEPGTWGVTFTNSF
jgi:iron complex outermembrane recepter protein